MIDENPCHWSPGIRMGVKPGSWYHATECFGPVLGVMCVEDFEEAMEVQNSSAFGLTGGLHSLDPNEIAQWREWNHDASLDWHLLDHDLHSGMKQWVRDLNLAYRREKALHVGDCDSDGFMWVDCDNADESIISWERIDPN